MQKTELLLLILSALAALLHGMSGFGFPMMSTAALAMFYPLKYAIALVAIPCIILNISLLRAGASHPFIHYLKRYSGLIVSSLVGSFIGVSLLLYVSEAYLKLLMGTVILLYVADQFRTTPIQLSPSMRNMTLFGGLAGIIGGATNAMAPFLMMYLLSTKHQKNDVVIISNMSFLASKLVQLVMLTPIILTFQTTQIYLLILITITALIFVYIGSRIRGKMSQSAFNMMIFIALGLLGMNAIWQGFQQL